MNVARASSGCSDRSRCWAPPDAPSSWRAPASGGCSPSSPCTRRTPCGPSGWRPCSTSRPAGCGPASPGCGAPSVPTRSVSTAGGYQLAASVDAQRFDQALVDARRLTTADARCRALRAALAISGGPALDEFADEEWAIGEATRLDEMQAAATEDFVEALIEGGRCAEAIATISEHVARLPLRDRARGLLLRALAGAGRQAEALRGVSGVPHDARRRGRHRAVTRRPSDRAAGGRRLGRPRPPDVGRRSTRRGRGRSRGAAVVVERTERAVRRT